MTAKEKAIELCDKMFNVRGVINPLAAKQCAIIAVDELIDSIHIGGNKGYWQEVRIEINKLKL